MSVWGNSHETLLITDQKYCAVRREANLRATIFSLDGDDDTTNCEKAWDDFTVRSSGPPSSSSPLFHSFTKAECAGNRDSNLRRTWNSPIPTPKCHTIWKFAPPVARFPHAGPCFCLCTYTRTDEGHNGGDWPLVRRSSNPRHDWHHWRLPA